MSAAVTHSVYQAPIVKRAASFCPPLLPTSDSPTHPYPFNSARIKREERAAKSKQGAIANPLDPLLLKLAQNYTDQVRACVLVWARGTDQISLIT